jgi:uncharacterized protein (DUF4213/DUF364 family)
MTLDPIVFFYQKFGYKPEEIARLSIGTNYVGIMLKNGQIGVAATLKNPMPENVNVFTEPKFDVFFHRVVLVAYYNALLNYSNTYDYEADIFQELRFDNYKNLVMVGLFETLYTNLSNAGISVTVFDADKSDSRTKPMKDQGKIMKQADAAIITSTSIINGSFNQLLSFVPKTCDVFLLGPSGTLSVELFALANIQCVFGSVFDLFNYQVLDVIEAGAGTKGFLPYLHKVFIKNS